MRHLFLLGLGLAIPVSAAERIATTARFGYNQHVEYLAGDLPIVLTSPHGGRLQPANLPDRTEGVTSADLNTQELARAIGDALVARTGQGAHLVVSHLHRRKLDPNREIKEAAAGNIYAERAWQEFHAFVRQATAAAVARHGFAFLIDIHGHAHELPRLELGYGLGSAQLNQNDRAFDASDFAALSTVRDLRARLGGSGADLIRGPRSLGALFTERGIRAVPSPKEPGPGPGAFFSGGYIVQRHAGAPETTKVNGVQFEAYKEGIRDTAKNREQFAAVTVEVLAIFLRERYGYELSRPPAQSK